MPANRLFPLATKAIVISFLLAALVACDRPVTPKAPAPAPAAAPAWRYQTLSVETQPSFDLRFRAKTQGDPAQLGLRLVAGDEAGEAFFVEMGPRGVRPGRLSGGREIPGEVLHPTPFREIADAQFVLEWRPHRWALVADGRLLAGGPAPSGTPAAGGRVSFGVVGGDIGIVGLRLQPVVDIYFADSFMRTPDEPTSWTEISGTWELNALRDPLLSANAFCYRGSVPAPAPAAAAATAPAAPMADIATTTTTTLPPAPVAEPSPAVALAGEWFWSDISYRVAVRPADEGAVGIYFCHRGPDDYYLFRWTSRDASEPVRELIRHRNGLDTVLATLPGGCMPEQWYTLEAMLGPGWVKIAVDEHDVFTVRDAGLTYGRVGLHVEGANQAWFDDVSVTARKAALVDFGLEHLQQCLTSGGEWLPIVRAEWDEEAWPGGVVVRAPKDARMLWGQAGWQQYILSAQVGVDEQGAAGLCFRYQDDRNYYSARLRRESGLRVEICRVLDGREEVLASAPVADAIGLHRLAVVTDGGDIRVTLDGRAAVQAADYAFLTGRMGLCAESASATFSNVIYDFLTGGAPIAQRHEAFAAETYMSGWAGELSDWEKKSASLAAVSAQPVEITWHRSKFFGGVRADLRLPAPPAGPEGRVGLLLGGNGNDLSKGFLAVLHAGADASGLVVDLLADGQSVASAPVTWANGPMLFGLSRTGDDIVVHAGGETLLTHRAASGEGRRVGWFAQGVTVETGNVDIYSNHLVDYGFTTAPTDWRSGGGIWEVTSRYQCDPRWSFFSGRAEGGIAALWNKRSLRGDFTIEYFLGNKMDKDRGNQYEYAQDMNITVCADGKDLTSGYSFLFGGFDNTVTACYRKDQVWAKPEPGRMVLINRKGLHRLYYHIEVSRTGRRLEMRVNGEMVLSQEDSDPLEDVRWAIWTRDNGIMLVRVRVAAEEIGPCESPDPDWPLTTQAIYKK